MTGSAVAVIGAGWAGSTAARVLHDAGYEAALFERDRVLGGHSRSETINGVMYEPNGPHIFHTSNGKVARFVQAHGMRESHEHHVLTEVFLDDDDEDPVILSWPPQTEELKELRVWPQVERELARRPAEPARDNLEAYSLSIMGPTLYRLFVRDYSRKQWGREPTDLVIRRNRRGGNADLLAVDAHIDHKDNDARIEALRRLHETGLKQIYLGIESGAAGQLKRYYKGVRPEDNELALNTLRDLGIQAACGWIMFDPMVTAAEIQENVAFVRRNGLLPASPSDSFVTYPLSRMRPLEGSPSVQVLRDQNLLGPRTTNLVEYEVSYRNSAIAEIVNQVEEWERGIARPAMYELKNRIARMAWRSGRLSEQDKSLADLYFALKRLDLDLADELSRAALNGMAEAELGTVRRQLEETRSSLAGRVRELAGSRITGSTRDKAIGLPSD